MSKQSDRNYFIARMHTEQALAVESEDATIAALHSELANRYAEKLAKLEEEPFVPTLKSAES